jgi:hypothetical protein
MAKGNIKYHTIGVPNEQYRILSGAKSRYEAETGQKTDWGGFLALLAMGFITGIGIAIARGSEERRRAAENGHTPYWSLNCSQCRGKLLWPKGTIDADCPHCGAQLTLSPGT